MMQLRTYQDALDYIYSFIDPTRKASRSPDEAAVNTARMRALLAAAGDPQTAMPAVVVAGTKGKGSTAAMIEAIARAAGLRTGLFTSPHLSSYRERIQVNRDLLSQGELITLAARLQPTIEAFDPAPFGRPTTFDIGLLLALSHFATCGVELAVLEIGMGGRFDAVNVVTPLVSAISSISYDHITILGPSLTEIAWNKAGIIKPGVPVVTIPQPPEAATLITEEVIAQGAPLWIAAPTGLQPPAGGLIRPYSAPPRPALLGAFQVENARLALGVAMLLRDAGVAISDGVMAAGLASVRWPGRFELIRGAPPVLIDGAHNGDSAQKLAAAMATEVAHERLVLVLGTSRDKDIAAMAAALVPHAAAVVLTRSGHPRAMDMDRIVAEVGHHLRGPLVVTPDVRSALDAARNLSGPRDLICVTGSLFVVAAAREAMGLAVPD
jgi:dihydrofolate synthase/folylpolyglutamate synthase